MRNAMRSGRPVVTMLTGLIVMVVAAAGPGAFAQQGTGAATGVARGDAPPAVERIEGVVTGATIGRCENTTGRARVGGHVQVDAPGGRTWNVHLGPLFAVEELLATLPDGTEMSARVFRTDAMPAGHVVALDVTVAGETTVLRGEDLRPTWARGRAGRGLRPGRGAARGGIGAGGGRGGDRGAGCWWVLPEAPGAAEGDPGSAGAQDKPEG